ncbi:uncharacterized protein BDR25DRAFT_206684 [Lindgomyces ingoldianus]|uniref:Uncharacterized protein n=1 Tax=Lindgomyces ingoldianus TaxID=673940 RepID=A0ACB6RHM6_9PLEO|nr:uncharacterized protein BDR25DRAFT_206684 [Lindgomyces ingoldianus]KAF2477966.1 hypothetical protein BDR25DRAFT_206684 [Lindgomyces ingoldianus]
MLLTQRSISFTRSRTTPLLYPPCEAKPLSAKRQLYTLLEMEEADIAAAMGFSAFGGTKRKYDETNSQRAKASTSGANSTRLGVRSKITLEAQNNEAESEPNQPASKADGKLKQSAATGLAEFLSRGKEIEQNRSKPEAPADPSSRDNTSAVPISFGGAPISHDELAALRKGVKDEAGDIAYFLPSFVQDPWEQLWKNRR